jgi:uncharacterized SAM-binding protein YcdF (DUF218 family)
MSLPLNRSRANLRFFGNRKILPGITLAVLALLFICAFVWTSAFSSIANLLIDPDPPEKADLIFLLGGDYLMRAPLAADLFQKGYAPKIVISREPTYYSPKRTVNFTDSTIQLLTAQGVPRDRIIDFSSGAGVKSTADEARALRLYVDAYPAKRILAVTSMLHSRRARMALNRSLRGTGIQVLVVCAGNPVYSKTQEKAAKLECVKMIYYFFTFFG